MFKLLTRVVLAIEGLLLCGSMATAQSFVLDLPRGSQHAVLSQRIGITDITINYHRPAGEQTQDLGRPGALRTSLACRSQRKYHDRLHRSCHHRGQSSAQRDLWPAHDSRRKRVDRHFFEELDLLGKFYLRPGRRRSAGHGQAASRRFSRSAYL